MYAAICGPQFWHEIEQAVNSKGEQILYKTVGTDIDISSELEKVGRIAIRHLIIDISCLSDDKNLIQFLRRYRIKNDNTQVIIIAPNCLPGNVLLHNIVTMGIYDILAPSGDKLEDITILPSLTEVFDNPSPYKKAVKWVIDDDMLDSNQEGTAVKEKGIFKKTAHQEKTITIVYNKPNDYKKKVAFLGHDQSGVTSLICWVSNYLSINNIKVAIMDLSGNKALYEIYPFNLDDNDVNKKQSKNSLKELLSGVVKPFTIHKNLDLFTAPYKTIIDPDKLTDLIYMIEEEYDVLIIDADYDVPMDTLQVLNNIYILQTLDAKKLKYNTEYQISMMNAINIKKIKYIINNVIQCSIKPSEIIDCLKVHTNIETLDQKVIAAGNIDSFIVPFNLQAHINSIENNYNFDKIDMHFIDSIKAIARDIYPIGDETHSKNDKGFKSLFFKK